MERKLLSLPSFFVLLLVAGIAFLAAPVGDVQAAPELLATGAFSRATTTPTGADLANAVTKAGNTNLVIIKFQAPVKVTGTDAQKFDSKDVQVVVTNTSGNTNLAASQTLASGAFTVNPIATTAAAPLNGAPAANQWFVVNAAVPANGTGTITVSVLGSGSNGAFQDAGDDTDWGTSATQPASGTAHIVHYNNYDGTKPTVLITAGAGATGTGSGAAQTISVIGGEGNADIFQLEFQFSEALGTSGDAGFAHAADVSIVTTPASTIEISMIVKDSWPKPGAAAATPTFIVVIDPPDDVTKVTVGVKKDAVADANGNKLDPAYTKDITINSRPTVAIELTSSTVPIPQNTTAVSVTFELSADPGTGNAALEEDEIEVTNGTLQAGTLDRDLTTPPTATVAVIYTAMVTLPAKTARMSTSPLTITVEADSVEVDGLGNIATTETFNYTPPPDDGDDDDDGDDTPVTGTTGTALTGKRGFSFDIPAIASAQFVVLAKFKDTTTPSVTRNGIASGVTVIDIKDEVWEDLRDFLAYDGGTIDLKGPAGTTAEDLVISEIMWGSDHGLSDPAMSQWIELYNTRSTTIAATSTTVAADDWTLEFLAGAPSSATVSDRFSNRKLGETHWSLPDTSGGAYGQSGRTRLTPGTPGSLRDLVSMRRDINYTTVEKRVHDTNKTAAENRVEQLKGVPDGGLAASWKASTSRVNMSGTRRGTPGAKHVVSISTTGISKSVVFNEIANRSTAKFDWIELYNPGSADVKINNWVLSKVTAVDTDDKLFKFESDENIVVPAKGFLLVVNEDPSETALAAGENVDNPNSRANNLPTKVYVNSGLNIPKEKFLLILRTEEKLKSHEKIVDIGGHLAGLTLEHTDSATELWPLKAWKRIKEDDLKEDDSKTWVRDKGKDLYHGDAWKLDGGFTGLGIDRNPASNRGPTSGTPGFDNGAIKDKVKDLTASDPVVISEIMFGTGSSGRRVPQWIELYNPSDTQAVKLNSWRLEVRNTNDASESLNVELSYTLILPDVRVLPKQTVLIVSSSIGEATRNRFPSDRIINLWSNRSFRDITEATSPRDPVLSSVGFYIKLSDPEKQVVDQVGNIDGTRRSDDTPAWTLPGGNLEDGGRASMIRREGTFGNGTEADAWISANATNFAGKVGIKELYYGDEDDVGTPGYRAGGPLPVQLSSFYSKRNDAGAVIITWATESELDNAGFNILRSLSRVGEFTRINAQLIPGAGTTGEKNTYTWTDTSARPNVVYYYQIEDVSLDGEHRTLRTTRLRGYVGASGKATTIWGELKSRD